MTSGPGADAVPTDRGVDRRSFLRRMTALTAAAAGGGALARAGQGASPARKPGLTADAPLPGIGQVPADPSSLTLAGAAHLIREGRLAPVELLEAYLERIRRWDGVYMAFNTVRAEAARERARRLADAPYRGPLHGIPLAIKDNFYTAGVPTTANSHIYADFVPEWDATAWARLEEAGAILLGKTQMGPLATSRATTPDGENTTVNAWAPHEPSVSPGGSSSGSATAVAARMAASSTGTQTGGSITRPSNAQGLTGLKPTMGRVSLHGIIPLTYTRDHPGPLARDAMDAALMLQAMAGSDPADPRTRGLPPVPDYVTAATPAREGGRTRLRWPTTVGVFPDYTEPDEPDFEPESEEEEARLRRMKERGEEAARAREEMLGTLERLGARLVEVDYPADWETLTSWDFNNVRLPERSEPFMEVLRDDVRRFGVSLSPWINGLLLPGAEYLRGQRAKLLLLRRILDDLFGHCDVVVQTSTLPFDMTGLPLVAFPVGMEETRGFSRPVGAMLGGQPYAEDRLLSLVAAYQDVTGWHRERPPTPEAFGIEAPGPGGRERDRGGPGSGEPGSGTGPVDLGAGGALGRGRMDAEEVMRRCE